MNRKDLTKNIFQYSRELLADGETLEKGLKTRLSKMQKEDLERYEENLFSRVMVQDIIKDAAWHERNKLASQKCLQTLVQALIQENHLTSKELYYWSFSKLVVNEEKASEHISISCRASVWSKYASASIDLNGTVFEVKHVYVWGDAHGL